MYKIVSRASHEKNPQEILKKIFIDGSRSRPGLEEWLNFRWTEQDEISESVDCLIKKILGLLAISYSGNSSLKKCSGHSRFKEEILNVINATDFMDLLEKPEHSGWKSLINQIRKSIE